MKMDAGLLDRRCAVNPEHEVLGLPGACANTVCPLNQVRAGMAVRIKQLCASPEITSRLREIGLGEERIVKLLTSASNIICLVCNARLALSQQLAQSILVEPLK